MKIQKVQVTGAEGSTVDCGYFSNALYDTYLQLTTTAEIGKQYNIHGYIRSNKSGTIRCQDVTANVTTSWQEIKMTIIPTSNILELYFYPGEFYLYKWKMEAGTISSPWTPSPLDVKYDLIEMGTIVTQLSNSISSKVWQNDINTATGALDTKITEVKQNADKVSWLVKSGSSESDMVLTDTAYTLISENINLKGNAVFTSFLNDDQTAINGGKIATGTITADKLNVTDLSALSASIGGWKISNESIYTDFWDEYSRIMYDFSLNTVDSTESKVLNVTQNDESIFYIQRNGYMYANNATINGSVRTNGRKKIYEDVVGMYVGDDGFDICWKSTSDIVDKDVYAHLRATKSSLEFIIDDTTVMLIPIYSRAHGMNMGYHVEIPTVLDVKKIYYGSMSER